MVKKDRNLFTILLLGALLLGGCLNTTDPKGVDSTQVEDIDPGPRKWKQYKNTQFDFCVPYPADLLLPQGETDGGDGQTFKSPDGFAELAVYATYNPLEYSVKDFMKEDLEHLKNNNSEVTYKKEFSDGYVLSGYQGKNHIFYFRKKLVDGQLRAFSIGFPKNQKKVYDPIIDKIYAKFPDC